MIVENEIKKLVSKELNIDDRNIKMVIPKLNKYGYINIHYHDLIGMTGLSKEEIKKKLEQILNIEYVEKIEYINEYCNVFIFKSEYINYFIKNYNYKYVINSLDIGKGQSILLEHTSSTPDSSPHLGRSRGTIIGDFLKHILTLTNFDVKTEYFVNDLAKQVSMVVSAYDFEKKYNLKQISEIYQKVYNACKQNEDIEKFVEYQIKQCQNGNIYYKQKFKNVVDNYMEEQEKLFDEFNVYFDNYVYESDILDSRQAETLQMLADKNLIKIDGNGCICVPMSKKNSFIKNIILTRSNGSSLYIFRDLCYFIKKHKDYEKNIIVLPEYQKEHINDINYILSQIGLPISTVIYYADSYNKGEKMSTKNNSGVLLEDLIGELRKLVLEANYGFDNDTIKNITNKVIRKYVLNFKPKNKLIYNAKEIEKMCYLEIKKTLFMQKLKENTTLQTNENFKNQKINFELIKKMDMFDDIVKKSVKSLQISLLLKYEQELDKIFLESYTNGETNHEIINIYILINRIINEEIIDKICERKNPENESSFIYTNKIK